MANNDQSWDDDSDSRASSGGSRGDRFTEVTRVGWLQRIWGSFGGVLVGLVLFLGAFVLLYWNEGRLDLSTIAKRALTVQANLPSPTHVGKLVAVTGPIVTNETLGDAYVAPGKYVALRRKVEMYAWDEVTHTETKRDVGGSETKIKTYEYRKTWTTSPENSGSFKRSSGHHNPSMAEKSEHFRARDARVGVYGVDLGALELPAYEEVDLNGGNTRGGEVDGDYLYLSERTGSPRVGDIRLAYEAVPSGQKVTLFGKLKSPDHVASYKHSSSDTLYRAVAGEKDEAIKALRGEHATMTWILRLVGFLMMWIGLALVTGPINVLLDVLPFLGNMSRGLTGFGAFVIAVVLSVVTILVAIVLHNLVAMIVIGLVTVAVGSVILSKKKARPA